MKTLWNSYVSIYSKIGFKMNEISKLYWNNMYGGGGLGNLDSPKRNINRDTYDLRKHVLKTQLSRDEIKLLKDREQKRIKDLQRKFVISKRLENISKGK